MYTFVICANSTIFRDVLDSSLRNFLMPFQPQADLDESVASPTEKVGPGASWFKEYAHVIGSYSGADVGGRKSSRAPAPLLERTPEEVGRLPFAFGNPVTCSDPSET